MHFLIRDCLNIKKSLCDRYLGDICPTCFLFLHIELTNSWLENSLALVIGYFVTILARSWLDQ